MRWFSLVIGGSLWLSVGAGALVAQSGAEEPVFPGSLSFEVRNGLARGSFDLGFGDAVVKEGERPRYQISARNFSALGVGVDQELWSYVFRDDLSLYGHLVKKANGPRLRQVFVDDQCKSALGQVRTTCFLYQEHGTGDSTQTEIYAPYPALDLLSSILIATRLTARGQSTPSDFVLIHEDNAKKVSLVPAGKEPAQVQGKSVPSWSWSLRPQGSEYEIYRFQVAHVDGGYLPVKVVFDLGNRGPVELVIESWTW